MKLCRRAGKRQDEILEDEVAPADDDIVDVVKDDGEDVKQLEEKHHDLRTNVKHGIYGPDQFTDEDVLAVAKELEKEEPGDDSEDVDITSDEDGRSAAVEAVNCQKKRCSQCQVWGVKTCKYVDRILMILCRLRVVWTELWSPWFVGTFIVRNAGSVNW